MESKSSSLKTNPFPGLRPFLPEESELFFGRERESEEILKKLLSNRFVAVIGASGSGKSSLVNSGVVPKLMKNSQKDKSLWKVIKFHPGSDPLESLASAFAKTILGDQNFGETDKSVISHLRDNPDWIASALQNLIVKKGERTLIIIDQFEEIFRYSTDGKGSAAEKDTLQFARLLENAVSQTLIEVYIIIIMRSDFVGEFAHFHGLIQLMNNSSFLVPRMTWENYKAVIENPIRYAGAEIDPGLVVTILNDLGDQSDQLPVLQHLMMRTFSFWQEHGEPGSAISVSDYNAVGTISGAMSRHADEAWNELPPEGKEICKRVFKTITGKGSDNKGVRHPLSIGALKSIIQCSEKELFEVIEKFRTPSRSFIIPRYDVPLNDDSVIDISHESLMRLWGRLKEWVDDEASSARMYRRLSEASTMYQQGKTTLLKNPDLQLAINWREKQKPTLKWAERYDPAFERAMVYLRTSEKAYLDDEENKIRLQRRKIKSSRLMAMILGSAAIISLGFMLVAFIQKKTSEKQRSEVLKQKEEAVAYASASEKVAILSRVKLASADSAAAAARQKEAEAQLQKELSERKRSEAEQNTVAARKQQLIALEQSDSAKKASILAEMNVKTATEEKNYAVGKRMISLGKSLALKSLQLPGQKDLQTLLAYQGYIFNSKNGGSPNDADIYQGLYNIAKEYGNINYKIFAGHSDEIKSIAFVPGKREFYTSGSDGKILKWNLDSKNQSLQIVYAGDEIINVLRVSPDAGWLACGSQNSEIKMIPLKENSIGYELKGHTGAIRSLIFSFDGRYLYSASLDGKVLKWDLTAKTYTNISENMLQITSIDLSSDNKYIAGVSNDGKVIVWNPQESKDNFRIESAGKTIKAIRFKPDENILAVGYTDGYFEIWDISARLKISEIKAHTAAINDIRFNSKFSQIATAANDGTLKLWNSADFESLPVSFNDNEGFVVTIEFSPDGLVIVSGTSGKSANLTGRAAFADLLATDICTTISRNFTLEEWIAYVGKDIEYEKTCPGKEYNIKVKEIR